MPATGPDCGYAWEVPALLPHHEVMLQNSAGATMLLRRSPDERPVESILVQIEPKFGRAVLFDVPEGWLERRMVLHCEVYADGGVLAFSTLAVPLGNRAVEFGRPQDVTLLKQREFVRVPCDLPVRLVGLDLRPGAPDPNLPGQRHRLINISAGGAALQTKVALSAGQTFGLQFTSPDWHTAGQLPVKVVHVLEPGPPALYGLSFGNILPRQRTELNSKIAALLRAHRQERREEARRWLR